MVISRKCYLGFGSTQKRFGIITVHPNLDPSGLYTTRPEGCDPCLYHPKPIHEIFQVNKSSKNEKDPWRYKTELEEWAKNLGYRNQKVLAQRKWFNSILGPAWHEVTKATKYQAACQNVGFGRTNRFKQSKNKLPGPGNYYKSTAYNPPYGPHSTRATFEREEPCRFKDTSPKWSLASNRYTIIDKDCIELKPKKVVSLRGPYDLFTGKRDGSTIKNHFNTESKVHAASWPLALKSTLDKYTHSHFGVMNKTNRNSPYRGRNMLVDLSMCLRKPTDPGPSHYNIDEPKTLIQNKRGFNSSYDKPPGYKRTVVWPAVGRYNIKSISCGIKGQGHRHVFLSTQKRTIGAILPEPMNSF
ncbi:lymphocyte expansion molecule-like [Bicyclus anynana]|uniref:Lymphocyte expansion molecule-like n=1 Tax=Bicyclus anynana TaxID=110368 RepID=A0A6J1MVS3_BICAN|nr:lymphocyte expansion molecule-like [Bicyclus anynana]